MVFAAAQRISVHRAAYAGEVGAPTDGIPATCGFQQRRRPHRVKSRPATLVRCVISAGDWLEFDTSAGADRSHGAARVQSRSTTLRSELLILSSPLYSINPSFRNLFMKKFTRDRVVPTISASVSCDTFGKVR